MMADPTMKASASTRCSYGVVSLFGDGLRAWLARNPSRNRVADRALDFADSYLWGSVADAHRTAVRSAVVANLAPTLMETGFRLGSALVATSRSESDERKEQRQADASTHATTITANGSSRTSVNVSRSIVADALPALAGLALARWPSRLPVGNGPLGWGALSLASGFAIGRLRAQAQESTRESWRKRTNHLIWDARIRSRVQTALVHNAAHIDPKGLLAFLERAGSSRAGQILDLATSDPRITLAAHADRGTTLAATVDFRAIIPDTHRIRWLGRPQVQQLRDDIAAIDQTRSRADNGTLLGDNDGVVHVISANAQKLVLRYRGEIIEASLPTPELTVRLEPTVPALMVSSIWTSLTAWESFGSAPAPIVLSAVAAQWAAIRHLLLLPIADRRGDTTSALLVAGSTLAVDIAVGLRAQQDLSAKNDAFAGTGATLPLMLLLGGSWHDLPKLRWYLVACALGGWVFALRALHDKSWNRILQEALFVSMPAAASWGIAIHTRRDAQNLDEELHAQLSEDIRRFAHVESAQQLSSFIAQLDTVIDELPELHPGLDDNEVTQILAAFRAERERVTGADPLTLIGW